MACKRTTEDISEDMSSEDTESVQKRPCFPPVSAEKLEGSKQMRKVFVPLNRRSPLQDKWGEIFTPIVEQLHLQIRYNLKTKCVELKTCAETSSASALQKGADFVKAFVLGFDVNDALALVRLEDLYIETFDVKDVKTLKGDHLGRAVGRLAGRGGKTKFSIENATKTRIVLADCKVHILGSYHSIQVARRAISDLIMGTPPAKIYGRLRVLQGSGSSRM